jgi:hypothetical protein
MRGNIVIIRTYGDVPLVRRVWDEDDSAIYITNDEQFQLLTQGKEALQPVGFPREDVFQYNPDLAAVMDQLVKSGKWDWNKLVSF